MKRTNWLLTAGFLLTLVAFFSYIYVFSQFPITRDVPWVNFILLAIAAVMLIAGARRARHKVLAGIVATLGILIAVFFVVGVTVGTRLPRADAAPKVGQRAPEFALSDSNGKLVSLTALEAAAPRGVLLVFYRGYW